MKTTEESEVTRLRIARERLEAERPTLARTEVPRDAAVARVERHITASAARVEAPSVAGYLSPDFDAVYVERTPLFYGADLADVVAALFPDRVRELMLTAVDEHLAANPQPRLAEPERLKRLAELDAKVLALEIAEEQAIRRAEKLGHPIDRRGEADPAVVLAERL